VNDDAPESIEEDIPDENEESGGAGMPEPNEQSTTDASASDDAELAGAPRLLAPVRKAERISSVDALRGIALLGILLMNIVGFGLPHQAYTFPNVAGGDTGLNLAVWSINSVMFEGSMRAIFSMLFGAGMLLLTSRLEARKGTGEVADIYYRRTLWLLAFGVVHAYLFLWYGDILYGYAAVGLFLYPFRKMSPRGLITIGVLLLLVLVPKSILGTQKLEAEREAAMEANAAAERGDTLTQEQEDAQRTWKETTEESRPTEQAIQEEVDEVRSGYWTIFTGTIPITVEMQSSVFYLFIFWDIAGMMFLGIGMMKLGIFSASRSTRFYITMAAVGYAVALPIRVFVAYDIVAHDFEIIRFSGYSTIYTTPEDYFSRLDTSGS